MYNVKAKEIIYQKANVNQTDADGNSLLNKACWRGYSDIAQLLIANGADVDSQNEAGNSSLNVCAHKGYSYIAEVSIHISFAFRNKLWNSFYTILFKASLCKNYCSTTPTKTIVSY